MVNSNNMPSNIDWAERRGTQRRAILVKADVHLPGKAPLIAHAVDVSIGGLGLLSPTAVNIDQELVVNVPFDVGGASQSITLTGRVCYCTKQADNCYRVGLQFVKLDPHTAAFVAAICS